jgi:hypothetical protein
MADLRTPLRASRPPSPYRRSRGPFIALMVLLAVGVGAVVFLVTTAGEDTQPELSTGPAPTSTVGSTTTVDPEAAIKAEIITAYRQSWDAFIAVGSDPNGRADDPRLSERKKGTALAASQLVIRKWRADGHVLESSRLELNPTVVELGPDTAVVEDCLIDVSGLVDQDSGEVIEAPGPPELAMATVNYELVNGVWMQNSFTDEGRPCVLPES